MIEANLRETGPPGVRLEAGGRSNVTFALNHPGLFLLMYRSERLDMCRPALRDAVAAFGRVQYRAVGAVRGENLAGRFSCASAPVPGGSRAMTRPRPSSSSSAKPCTKVHTPVMWAACVSVIEHER